MGTSQQDYGHAAINRGSSLPSDGFRDDSSSHDSPLVKINFINEIIQKVQNLDIWQLPFDMFPFMGNRIN
jgi:hypothetical protein